MLRSLKNFEVFVVANVVEKRQSPLLLENCREYCSTLVKFSQRRDIFMRKIFVTLVMLLICVTPSCAAERFVKFPAIGVCTGTYVRYREDPDTESEILGRLNTPDRVIVLGRTSVGGDTWYEIEDPRGDRPAYVFGKYIVPVFSEKIQRSKTYALMVDILQNFGITRDRAEFYDGPKVKTRYTDDYLTFIDATRQGTMFGEISIGDDRDKVESILDDPEVDDEDMLDYRLDVETGVRFIFEDGKITRMVFEY